MEKLELKSKEQIEIQDGAMANSFKVEVGSADEFKELYNKFTDDNLSQITFLSETGEGMAIYKDKTLSKAELETITSEETGESKKLATFILKDIDLANKRLKYIEETVDALILNSMEVK